MKDTSTLVFTGDIGFDKYMDGRWRDSALLSSEVRGFIEDSDHLIVNVEGALSEGEKTIRPNGVAALLHSMNPEVGKFLKEIRADVWSIANNHIMDAGPKGLKDTLDNAACNGAYTIGAGMNIKEASKPLLLDEAGGIGLFAVGYQRACRKADEETPGCLSWSDMETIRSNIEYIKSKCRWCIVVAHGGEEFTPLPSPYTRDRYIEYLNMGADIVVSHHPHVPMNYELIGEKAIFYSLGNFIFDTDYQRAQYHTEQGVILKLKMTQTSFSFEPLGIEIEREHERIVSSKLPLIFENVDEEEYELLEPLSAAAFIEATKRQQIYFKPDKYSANTTDEEWLENFMEPMRSGRVPGEALDMQIILPIAEKAGEEKWKKSKLKNVVKFILEQCEEKT